MPADNSLPEIDDPNLRIDELIEQIIVDAYGDEAYWSFRQAFEDHVDFPIAAWVIGAETTITEIDFDGDERRGLVAKVTSDGQAWTISILDIEVPDSEARFSRLARAYQRWLGEDQ